jgi:hypothetical protein
MPQSTHLKHIVCHCAHVTCCVPAALQNIGAMIKQNFPQSQFIVVSLKEGLFNNANVIFRTKFVDGVSQVLRTENNTRRWGAPGAACGAACGAVRRTEDMLCIC